MRDPSGASAANGGGLDVLTTGQWVISGADEPSIDNIPEVPPAEGAPSAHTTAELGR
jgi:hypothetical protein